MPCPQSTRYTFSNYDNSAESREILEIFFDKHCKYLIFNTSASSDEKLEGFFTLKKISSIYRIRRQLESINQEYKLKGNLRNPSNMFLSSVKKIASTEVLQNYTTEPFIQYGFCPYPGQRTDLNEHGQLNRKRILQQGSFKS